MNDEPTKTDARGTKVTSWKAVTLAVVLFLIGVGASPDNWWLGAIFFLSALVVLGGAVGDDD